MKKITSFLRVEPIESTSLNVGLLLLRVLFGLSLAFGHGRGTFMAVLRGEFDYPDPIGLGPAFSMSLMGFAEFVCALLVVFGVFTRLSIIPIILGFFVAFFVFHGGDPFNAKELAYLYGSSFLIMILVGPGKYSVDYHLFKIRP